MKTKLTFTEMVFRGVQPLDQSSVPAMLDNHIIQNQLHFNLNEYEEIYEGYGLLKSSYPYTQQDGYDRSLSDVIYSVAILENDYLCATFIIDLGGRLWSLIDKVNGQNLLYTNDVIRFSNLASRNAWFSGGVEWNMGIVGHSPFTCERLFASRLPLEDGTPVLRMYEHERVRAIEFQMDFILRDEDRVLTCRMKTVNSSSEVIPCYWWSNIAVPEYSNGRIVVPAKSAYFCDIEQVRKVNIPYVSKNRDISNYTNIPYQADFFFDMEKKKPKYIANFNESGEGLLHLSTDRLQARKLFTWGDNQGAENWQRFLTENAGRYIEIQAGLAKTQYGCIPMPPNCSWDWIEQYGPISIPKEMMKLPYEDLECHISKIAEKQLRDNDLERMLVETRNFSKTPSGAIIKGSNYGILNNYIKEKLGKRNLTSHLDFGDIVGSALTWKKLLDEGFFDIPNPSEKPEDFICNRDLYVALVQSINGKNRNNWYAYYQIGLFDYWNADWEKAKAAFSRSHELTPNAWNLHALAIVSLVNSNTDEAANYIKKGLSYVPSDLSYVKETYRVLLACGHFKDIIGFYENLTPEFQANTRLKFGYCIALYKTSSNQKAWDLITAEEGFILDDNREGQNVVAELYTLLHEKLFGPCKDIPANIDFNASDPNLSRYSLD